MENKIVNLFGRNLNMYRTDGSIERIFEDTGKYASVIGCCTTYRYPNDENWIPELNDIPVYDELDTGDKVITVCDRSSGESVYCELPDPQEGVYYIVREAVARVALKTGRSTKDLLVPNELVYAKMVNDSDLFLGCFSLKVI